MCGIDCLCILQLLLGILFVFSSSSVVAVEARGLRLWGKGGVSRPSVCPAHTITTPAATGPGRWVGPRRKYLYLFPRCYFSGPHGFIKSFGGYFGSFGGRFAWLPVGANHHWVIFFFVVYTFEECGMKPRNLRYGQRPLLLSFSHMACVYS